MGTLPDRTETAARVIAGFISFAVQVFAAGVMIAGLMVSLGLFARACAGMFMLGWRLFG